jgi:Predicted hydrolases or acyltransferases (alpha/beta hydrolase superfamily)
MKIKKALSFLLVIILLTLSLSTLISAEITIDYTPKYNYKTLSTGIRMSYVELGDKNGEPLVLIHGATDSYISFSQVGAYLADMGYHVFIPELRGHGKTSKPEDVEYTMALHAEDIDSWMDKIKLDEAHFVGHSLGSFVAQELAITYPERVKSMTLIASSNTVADNPVFAWMLEGDDEFPGFINFDGDIPAEFIEGWTVSDNWDDDFIKYTYKHAEKLPYHVWINVFSNMDVDNSERLNSVTVPTLIIWGGLDDLFMLDEQFALIESLSSADVTFIKINNAGHNVHWSGEAGMDISQYIADFIK